MVVFDWTYLHLLIFLLLFFCSLYTYFIWVSHAVPQTILALSKCGSTKLLKNMSKVLLSINFFKSFEQTQLLADIAAHFIDVLIPGESFIYVK